MTAQAPRTGVVGLGDDDAMNTLQREGLSKAYVMAVSSVAGFQAGEPWPDVDGIDWTIAAPGLRGTIRSPKLDIQVKAHGAPVLDADLSYPLRQRNYELLIGRAWLVPRILVVMIQDPSEDPRSWIDLSDDHLAMRRCAYWVSLADLPSTTNQHSTSVTVTRGQRFTPDTLAGIMADIADRRFP